VFSIAVVSGQAYIAGMDNSTVTNQTNTKPANVVVRGDAGGFLQRLSAESTIYARTSL